MNNLFEKRSIAVDPEKEQLVLKVNMMLRNEELSALYFDIHEQYKTGVVVLPAFVDAAIVPKGTNIVVEVGKG
jgi:hypothetical protein